MKLYKLALEGLQTICLQCNKIPLYFYPFPNKPLFLRVCSTSLLKTLWEKDKLLITSSFSFSHSVFYPFRGLPTNFVKLKLSSAISFTLYHTILTSKDPWKKLSENIVGKGENAGNQHFLLFPQSFLSFPRQISIFQSHFFCRLQMLPIWTSLKFCRLVRS